MWLIYEYIWYNVSMMVLVNDRDYDWFYFSSFILMVLFFWLDIVLLDFYIVLLGYKM
jgi:hypothetical protein